ncbi:MAG: hypothetical protein PHF87_05795 [Desulfotomaculaceae bacterium]|nr:hypothetical protein [Desulfotomaculaceae bacterium]
MYSNEFQKLKQSIADIAVEAWRFRRIFVRAMQKLDAGDSTRYLNQFAWFMKKVDSALKEAKLRVINVEGQPFEAGMAVTPLNIDEFSTADMLYVEQMLEPIIMDNESIVKIGTVLLGRVER